MEEIKQECQPLSLIQKRNRLNDVYRLGGKGPGGAYHDYQIRSSLLSDEVNVTIPFQLGPRSFEESRDGVLEGDLLEIVRDRLACFQAGEFATRENAIALTHIEEALLWLNKRAEDRAERGVLGTYNK